MSPCVAHGLCVYLIHCPHGTCLHPTSISRRKDLFLPSSPSSVLAVSLISVFSLQWQTLPTVSVSLSLCHYYSSGNHLYRGWIKRPCACWACSLELPLQPCSYLTAFPSVQSIPPLSIWLLAKFLLNGHKTQVQRRQAGKLCPFALACPPLESSSSPFLLSDSSESGLIVSQSSFASGLKAYCCARLTGSSCASTLPCRWAAGNTPTVLCSSLVWLVAPSSGPVVSSTPLIGWIFFLRTVVRDCPLKEPFSVAPADPLTSYYFLLWANHDPLLASCLLPGKQESLRYGSVSATDQYDTSWIEFEDIGWFSCPQPWAQKLYVINRFELIATN